MIEYYDAFKIVFMDSFDVKGKCYDIIINKAWDKNYT